MGKDAKAITGILLAGGQSRRMGRDKRFLELDGRTLIERALSILDAVFPEVLVVVAGPEPRLDSLHRRVVTDLIPNCAALGGLYTGLSLVETPHIFVVATDMPLLNPAMITRIVALGGDADVAMVRLASGLQPMHAMYSKACLPHLQRMAGAGDLTIQSLARIPDLSVRIISEEEIGDIDPKFLSFLNINTPADFEFVRKLSAERRSGPQGG